MLRSVSAALLCLALAPGCPVPSPTCQSDTECLVGQRCDRTSGTCIAPGADGGRRDAGGDPGDAGAEPDGGGGQATSVAVVAFDRRVTYSPGQTVDHLIFASIGPQEVSPFCPPGAQMLDSDCCASANYPRDLSSKSVNAGMITAFLSPDGAATPQETTLLYMTDGYPPVTNVPSFDTGWSLYARAQGDVGFGAFITATVQLPAPPTFIAPAWSASAPLPEVTIGQPLAVSWAGAPSSSFTIALSVLDTATSTLRATVRCKVADTGGYTFTEAATATLTAGPGMLRIDRLVRAERAEGQDAVVIRAVHSTFGRLTLVQ